MLTTNDINTILQIIDIASQRGVFKANDLLTIGLLVDKLLKIKADNSDVPT